MMAKPTSTDAIEETVALMSTSVPRSLSGLCQLFLDIAFKHTGHCTLRQILVKYI